MHRLLAAVAVAEVEVQEDVLDVVPELRRQRLVQAAGLFDRFDLLLGCGSRPARITAGLPVGSTRKMTNVSAQTTISSSIPTGCLRTRTGHRAATCIAVMLRSIVLSRTFERSRSSGARLRPVLLAYFSECSRSPTRRCSTAVRRRATSLPSTLACLSQSNGIGRGFFDEFFVDLRPRGRPCVFAADQFALVHHFVDVRDVGLAPVHVARWR